MQIIGSLLATNRLSTVQLASMAGVGATQAIRQSWLPGSRLDRPSRLAAQFIPNVNFVEASAMNVVGQRQAFTLRFN